MPTDKKPPKDGAPQKPSDGENAPALGVLGDRRSAETKKSRFSRLIPKPIRAGYGRWSRLSARLLDTMAATDRRRRRSALAFALAINLIFITTLAVFGRVRIFVPNAPATSISIVLVDLPVDPLIPELRDPEIEPEPEPEPEPEEIEIVEEPEIVPEPEPDPVPEPEPEEQLEEPEAEEEIEEEPVIDLTPEPVFAPPRDVEDQPFIPDPTGEVEPEALQPTIEEPLPGDVQVEGEQTPADDAAPLVTVEPSPAGNLDDLEEAEDEETEEEGLTVGDDGPSLEDLLAVDGVSEEQPVEEIGEDEAPANDDLFDEDPFAPRSRLILPNVNLPEGEIASTPGTSGVVAIFCPEAFEDKDKQAECAGRREIRSGWRPGASGEDWSEAIRLLREARSRGDTGVNPADIVGADVARRMEDEIRAQELRDFRRSAGDVSDPDFEGTLKPSDRPAIGPAPFEPSWTQRDDPEFDQGDIEDLREALEEAERARSGEQ